MLDIFRQAQNEIMGAVRSPIAVPFIVVPFRFEDDGTIAVIDRQLVVWVELDVPENKPIVLAVSIGREDVDELHFASEDVEGIGVRIATEALEDMGHCHRANTGCLKVQQSRL